MREISRQGPVWEGEEGEREIKCFRTARCVIRQSQTCLCLESRQIGQQSQDSQFKLSFDVRTDNLEVIAQADTAWDLLQWLRWKTVVENEANQDSATVSDLYSEGRTNLQVLWQWHVKQADIEKRMWMCLERSGQVSLNKTFGLSPLYGPSRWNAIPKNFHSLYFHPFEDKCEESMWVYTFEYHLNEYHHQMATIPTAMCKTAKPITVCCTVKLRLWGSVEHFNFPLLCLPALLRAVFFFKLSNKMFPQNWSHIHVGADFWLLEWMLQNLQWVGKPFTAAVENSTQFSDSTSGGTILMVRYRRRLMGIHFRV